MPHRTGLRHIAEGARVGLRAFSLSDADEFTARARESRELHHPWLFPPLTPEEYAGYAGRLIEDPARAGFLVCTLDDGAIAGFININNIVRGGFQNGALGYGAFAHAAGRGLMREGLDLVVGYAFGPMRLHRLEINVQPGNAASIGLARACGFRREGFSPKMIYMDGGWRDHERWALTAEARPSG
ncbi:GNAT family N-acetyltransferase [Streptomyces sp. bgisy153]|uniref:GNAT family N-acetyltransferase n=1 Tax=Streptomyces sp. bgisy153 TaxID=3413793 RepID=UPI003D75A3E2